MGPTVSVICLCYNHEKYVGRAVQSILSQSMTDFELIVVDDGSQDRSREIVQAISDPRLRLITQENRGPGYASSLGVDASKGKLIALMSADDACAPHRLETQRRALEQGTADLHFCRPALIGDDDEPLPDAAWPIFFKRSFATQEELFRTFFFHGNFLCATSLMFRRAVIEEHGWVHTGLPQLQDFEFWTRLAPFRRFTLSDERLMRYRIRSRAGNLSSQGNKWRNTAETRLIYSAFFDHAPRDFLYRAFAELQPGHAPDSDIGFQVRLANLYLRHKKPQVRLIGIERLIDLLRSRAAYDEAYAATGLTVGQVSGLVEQALRQGGPSPSLVERLRNGLGKLKL